MKARHDGHSRPPVMETRFIDLAFLGGGMTRHHGFPVCQHLDRMRVVTLAGTAILPFGRCAEWSG